MAMSPLGSPQNPRQYSRESYNQTVGMGGARSNGAQPNAGGGGMDPNMVRPMMSRPYVPNLPQNGVRPTFGGAPAVAPAAPQYSGAGAGALNLGGQYAHAMQGAVEGYGQQIGARFRQDIGNMLGNLNGIGALRSGAVATGTADAMRQYGDEVGAYAAQTAGQAYGMGMQENDNEVERQFRQKQYDDAKKASHRRGLGKLLGGLAGGAIGLVTGGPAGALAGAKTGISVAGSL